MLEPKTVNKSALTFGIIFFGIFMVFMPLRELTGLFNYDGYRSLFGAFSEQAVRARYLFSVLFRILLITAGIGIILRKELFRRLLVLLSGFTIVTIFFKHPLSCFRGITDVMSAKGTLPEVFLKNPEMFVWIMFLYNCLLDLGVSVWMIYFFTRPEVKELFGGYHARS